MTAMRATFVVVAAALSAQGALAPAARAGEADDLQRMVDVAKQGATDLERLDELRVAREDVTLLRVWLDGAWKLRSEERYDDVRAVLDRCQAQAEMIRARIQASKVVAQAAQKEAQIRKVKADTERTRKHLHGAQIEKAALEGRTR